MVEQPVLIIVGQDWKPWQIEACSICGRGFTAAEWDDRHTDQRTGGDCHARCCPRCKP